jgi:hypothetical protein
MENEKEHELVDTLQEAIRNLPQLIKEELATAC